ncbi:OLC1v1016714C1 [Oldenlandia corymbosa var. corymbosa]|uniref:OLC1v1016714C1 n=1 Tax=Oldenlandia corymbosa var. corymbosa TaxID=529605 RepID=A0AAV1E7S6_OLDCO|nr:OLC1v1016714C1 [Oldenlandia corymbosa var. corymbosa]
MAAINQFIADINGFVETKSKHFSITVRVMTLWKMPESTKNKAIKSLEMVLIDANGGKVQATIPVRFMKEFEHLFKEGVVCRISGFDHALNINGGYRCSKHEYKIVFLPDTLVDSVEYVNIPLHVFDFTPFAEISNFIASFDYCFDIIGHIQAYSKPVVENGTKRISVELEDQRADRLKITLWNEHADRVLTLMDANPEYPIVLIVQYVKCKKYYSKASVTTNIYNGRIYLNDDKIPEIYDYKTRMDDNENKAASIHRIPILSSISGYTTYEDFVKEAAMISINGINDLEQPGHAVTFGKITGLAKEFDWSYTGCNLCNKKVIEIKKDDGGITLAELDNAQKGKIKNTTGDAVSASLKKWMCGKHGPVSSVAPKFKLQVYVADRSGSRIFTLWDRMVYNFITKSAAELREKEPSVDYPVILEEVKRKRCLFRLDVSNFNIKNRTSEVSVAKITVDSDVIKKYLEVVAEDQEIDPEISAGYGLNLTPTQDSTSKTAVSCTGDTEVPTAGDDTADSPPTKKIPPTQAGEESVKSYPNKRVRKL